MDIDNLAKRVADLCSFWNVNFTYANPSFKHGKAANERNCQDFVDAVLSKLDIKHPEHDEPTSAFLKKLKEWGVWEMEYEPSETIRKLVPLLDTKVFTQHDELDTYTGNLLSSVLKFGYDYYSEVNLLKHFDRVFYMRDYLRKQVVTTKGLNIKGMQAKRCPFYDPRSVNEYLYKN